MCASIRRTTFWLAFVLAAAGLSPAAEKRTFPSRVPPKRSSQVHNGFGINSDLPRVPYLPWDRWWWTRMFDAGVSWIRIGQYENSSDYTSWDWVEQKRGVYQVFPELEDYVDSLVDNGVQVQVQLHYGNPMYTSPSGVKPDSITPAPGSFHNADRSLYSAFWPPKTPEQIDAFTRYVRWIVNHFRGRIHHWALWNEQDIDYWNPKGNPEEYGRLLRAFVPAVRETDPQAKVIYGGLADPTSDFARRSLDACQCASGIDVFAYHTYPGYGRNLNPETMDTGAYGKESPSKLRELVRHYSGIRSDIVFWDDEFNSIPAWDGSDESVQAKYVPRGMIYNWAAGVRTFVWLLAAGTDGNEYDDFGFIHGLRNLPDDFTPRPVYAAYENTNALFSDTKPDPGIKIERPQIPELRNRAGFPFFGYGFRSPKGKAIVAYWLGAHSNAGNAFPRLQANLTVRNTGIRHPVLIDVVSGEISALEWKKGAEDVLESLPVKDSILAIADESYFDWPVLPEAPSGLIARSDGNSIVLSWAIHGGDTKSSVLERRAGNGPWTSLSTQPVSRSEYADADFPTGQTLSYRVSAVNDSGCSAYSNIVRVER
ncbi:MAG: hypothetical protein DMG57_05830 [Acidobacteria bacterium]|nr:MAG: hypothetical protein DMG57_05830 [Acidobacteriota bacterium]